MAKRKVKLTQKSAENSPAGGVVVGERNGQTMIYDDASVGGYFVGKTHSKGGIKMVNKSNGQQLEVQGSEVIITAPAVADQTKRQFEGKMMTNREILSTINEKGGGVAFAKGGDIPKRIKRTGASYKYGGKTMTDHEIYKKITGGHLAEGMTLTQIAKKHNVSVKELQNQVDMGMKAESEHTSSKREQMKIVKDHLYENPKYYSLLKRAGLKHGGRVSKASIIRNTKRANEQTKDLNNYNDVLDIDADGVYGAETGLFAKGGITDVVVNNWSDIPDSLKNVRLPKKIDYDINPDNQGLYEIVKPFLDADSLRPALQGINYDDNGVTVTNAHILLTIPTSQDYFRGVYKPKEISTKIDIKFPNYENVIPKATQITKVFYIDVLKLLTYCKVASNYSGKNEITFKVNDAVMHFDPTLTINFLSSLIKLTGQVFFDVSFETNKRTLVFSKYPSYKLGKDIIGLIMPYLYGKHTSYGTANKDKNTELNVYFDFDDNEIHNSDGSIVDLSIKPIKTRAKRTPKTIQSETSTPTTKTLTKYELENSKLWIGDDLDLRDKVIRKLIEIGFAIDKDYGDKDLSEKENIYIRLYTNDFVVYGDVSKEFFYTITVKEIFPSDLGIGSISASATSTPTTKTLTKYELEQSKLYIGDDLNLRDKVIRKLIEIGFAIDKEYGDKDLSEKEYIYIRLYTNDFVVYADSSKEYFDTLTIKEIFPSDIGISSTPTSISKFTAGEISAFKQIDNIVKENDFKDVSTTIWRDGSSTSSFFVTNDDTKQVFKLRSYYEKLGVVYEDEDRGKSQDLIRGYLDWKESTPTISEETITDEDVEIKKQILAFIKEGSWSLEKEIKLKSSKGSYKEFYKTTPPETIYTLSANRGEGLYPADEKTLKFLEKVGLYDDYEEPVKETSSEKFTSKDFNMFNQIDAIVDKHKIEFVDITNWGKDDKTKDFDIVNTITGDVFQLRKYNKSLGVQIEDINKDKSIALIRKYQEWKKSKTTKETEKVEVFRLNGISDDGTQVSDFGVYGATELLKNIQDLEVKYPERQFFPYYIYDFNGKQHHRIAFGKGIKTLAELEIVIISKEYFDEYDWTDFINYDKEISKVEQPKPIQTEKPKRNFELERKYLSQRISDLAKELDLKKPILSNEEVAFYQREINSFILKLRKLNDAEMSLKPIEERVRGVYGLKFASFDNEYPETDMISVNALKSQLTEKEYFNVRTPEFKSFFGDWETAYLNDSYAGVSKVINPITKEPQPVFHGTNVLFANWKTYETNNAHYFAVKREFSEFFATSWEERTDKAGVDSQILKKLNPNKGRFLFRCFIDVKNPIDFSRFGVEKYPIREFLTFLRVNYNIGDFDFWTNIASHSGFTQDTEVYAWQIIRLWQSFTKYVKVFTTYDGYIFYEYIPTTPYGGLENASLSYCAFDSNQIKFTDAYEFNALSNDSRFDLGGIL
jgi:hypothetical protein